MNNNMNYIKSVENLNSRKVIVRVGFNVPVGDDGIIDDKEDWRIKASIPTMEYLIRKGARVILASHLGRPKGRVVKSLKLDPVKEKLSQILCLSVGKTNDCIGAEVKEIVAKMKAGEIVLLENLRFHKGEKENSRKFAAELASIADIYVNDAFSVSHRRHASMCAITEFLPSYAGLLLEKEIRILSQALENPKRPAVVIIGGAKTETKLPTIKYLMNKFDYILTGGSVANAILKARKIRNENISVDVNNRKLRTPVDIAVFGAGEKNVSLLSVEEIEDGKALDIGSRTADIYTDIISNSKTIICSGPMGMFENEDFSLGTKRIAKAVSESKAYSIIGGGDTVMAFETFGCLDKIDYVCTGGGAMLEFLAGKELPAVAALENSNIQLLP